MTDIAGPLHTASSHATPGAARLPFCTLETHWGYIVRPTRKPDASARSAQWVAMVLGAIFLSGVISLWLWPALTTSVDAVFMRYAATILFGGFAALFLWYASRGLQSEIHVDLSRGEIREIVRHRTGGLTLISNLGFDSVTGVDVTVEPQTDGALVLKTAVMAEPLVVARAQPDDLAGLQARIARDVVVTTATTNQPAVNRETEAA